LGRAFALALAAEGAAIVVNGTNDELLDRLIDQITSSGGTAVKVAGSVAEDSVAEEIIATTVEHFGGIDAVVNNAGIVRDRTLVNMTPQEFDEVIAVNLRGTWSVSRHAVRAMREDGKGLLLQIVSGSAFIGSVGQTNYAASKAGVMGMLYAWDSELARYGIRTNALWPVAQTDMTQIVLANVHRQAVAEGRQPLTPEEFGFGTPEQVAPAVVYLCSERAIHLRSQLITFNGQKLAIWCHPHENDIHRQPSWTIEQIADVLADSSARVYAPQL